MNPGELKHRIDILSLASRETDAGTEFSWEEDFKAWTKYEYLDRANFFSRVGIGVKSIKFTIRKRGLTLHQAIKCQGKHYFLTDINEVNHFHYEVTAAQIEPKTCVAVRNTMTKDNKNRPVETPQTIASFPGYLVEKYLGYRQEKPQAVNDILCVLVTPKTINLKKADLITIEGSTYHVQVSHTLDEHKNEYEIALREE